MRALKFGIILGLVLLSGTRHIYGSSLFVSHAPASSGDTAVAIAVTMSNDKPLAGCEIDLQYNTSALDLIRIEPAARLATQSEFGFYEYATGRVALTIFDITGNNLNVDSADIFYLYFNVAEDSPDTVADISVYEIIAVDDAMEYDAVATTDGYVRIVGEYLYGDANCDLDINVGDVIFLINYIYKGGPAPAPIEAGDANGDCVVNVADAVYEINYIFKGGPVPVEGCFAPLKSNPPRNSAKVKFDLADSRENNGKITYRMSVESECNIAGVQIALEPAIDGLGSITTTAVKRAEKVPLIESEDRDPYVFGFIDVQGKEVIPAGEGEIAYIDVSVPEDYKGGNPVTLKEIVFADADGRVMKLDVQGIEQARSIPRIFSLGQNYPNPFNPMTRVNYALPKPSQVKLTIYNVLGQTVRVLIDEYQDAGEYSIFWDSKDGGGSKVASGVYFYQLDASGFRKTKKMLLLK